MRRRIPDVNLEFYLDDTTLQSLHQFRQKDGGLFVDTPGALPPRQLTEYEGDSDSVEEEINWVTGTT